MPRNAVRGKQDFHERAKIAAADTPRQAAFHQGAKIQLVSAPASVRSQHRPDDLPAPLRPGMVRTTGRRHH
jgi:hypothetical protein